MSAATCEKCGETLEIGSWPYCYGGHGRARIQVIDDQIEGGPRFFETFGHTPVWIESKSQWKLEADKRKDELVYVGDKHDRNWYKAKFRQHDEMLRDTGQK